MGGDIMQSKLKAAGITMALALLAVAIAARQPKLKQLVFGA